MMPFLYKALDRLVIRAAASRKPKGITLQPQAAEARQWLQRPDFFTPAVESLAIEFLSGKRFRFPSPAVSPYPENNIVHGCFFPCAGQWQEKPAIILLHGLNDVANHRFYFPWLARAFPRRGINAITLEFPYHFQRRSTAPGGRNFISSNLLQTVEATRQALAEIRTLLAWLRKQHVPRAGLWGISMGAWLAGLAACHDPGLGCAVLMEPVVDMDRFIREIEFCEPLRRAINRDSIDLTRLNLFSHQFVLPKENLLLVKAEYDQFVPGETLEQLHQAWGAPEIWRVRCGHIGILGYPGIMRKAMKWATERLTTGNAKCTTGN